MNIHCTQIVKGQEEFEQHHDFLPFYFWEIFPSFCKAVILTRLQFAFEMNDWKLILELLRLKVKGNHLTSSNIYKLYTTIIYFPGLFRHNSVFNVQIDKIVKNIMTLWLMKLFD